MKIILLDIDGVLSPLGRLNDEYVIIDLDGWSTIAIPHNNIEFIKTVNEKVKIVWSSSWEDISNNVCDKIDLPHFSFLQFYNTQQKHWNKLPSIVKFIEQNCDADILIIDDEVDTNAKEVLNKYKNITIIDIEPICGLSKIDKDRILDWLNSY